MHGHRSAFVAGILATCCLWTLFADASRADELELHTRQRVKTSEWTPPPLQHSKSPAPVSKREYTIVYETEKWDPARTAIIICDMWDTLKCRIPADRVAEMAPHMNEVITEARRRGVLIIHSPSGNVDYYKGTPQRALCLNAPAVESKVPLQWNYLNEELEAPLPIDDSDNGWEGPVGKGRPQTRQHDSITIGEGDAIGASKDVYYLLRQRNIENVIVMGVHTNMCVLGRPFGIRQLTYLGFNVALMRDMTDSLYNPAMPPYVNHFRGTEMVIEHIEKYWCPTILSCDFLNKPAFRFAADPRPHVVFLVSDDHYHADKTLPDYAQWLREEHQLDCSILHGEGEHDLPGIGRIESADAVVVYFRRLGLPEEQVAALKRYVASGRPMIGLRTANHAFALHFRPPADFKVPTGRAEWRQFDASILGGNYNGHGPNELGADVSIVREAASHQLLQNIPQSNWHSTGSLYYVAPIAKDAVPLMQGSIPDRTEPVTWIRPAADGRGKVFYSSLGHPDDFNQPAFRQLLVNAIKWALDKTE